MNGSATNSVFHRGEQAVQTRAGVREFSEHLGQRMMRSYLPGDHKAFFSQLPYVLIGAVDPSGRPWASGLYGLPGFVSVPDANTLIINTKLIHGDPMHEALSVGVDVGLLGIDYRSRSRSRVNGKVSSIDSQSIAVHIERAYGNCPQYIQSRSYELLPSIESIGAERETQALSRLDGRTRRIIASADHFFISTHFSEGTDDNRFGTDVSHRGGKPGFVRVDNDRSLTFPDFVGNNFFNTLGNITANPQAGVLFIDFDEGHSLYLTCKAEIIWDSPEMQAFVGADRLVRLTVVEGILVEQAVPIRWSFNDYSPSLNATGSWEEVAAKLAQQQQGNEYRDYRVDRIENESDTITSFYLVPEDGERIPCHVAGQFLPIEIQPQGVSAPINRTYTISNAPNGEYFRLSIKRELPAEHGVPAGLSSNYFYDQISLGSSVRALAPRGKFTLDETSARPVVLISGGVGVTPMIAMLEQLCTDSESCGCDRPIWFIHGAVNGNVHAFGDRVGQLADEYECVSTHFRYSDPSKSDIESESFDSAGHIDIELIKNLLPLDDHEFYLCGPTPFMESLYTGLKGLGISDDRIHYEFFGKGTKLKNQAIARSLIDEFGDSEPVSVRFARSEIDTTWDPTKGTLLDLAEAEGLQPAFSCRSGVCQSCATKVTQGEVAYIEQPMADPGQGSALICSAYPRAADDSESGASKLVLDL